MFKAVALPLDNIKEIAYQADYLTTLKLLEIYPSFNNKQFWDNKWIKMFPNENYLKCITCQDNFLMKERDNFENFELIFYDDEREGFKIYNNILYENNGSLYNKFEIYSNIAKDLIYIWLQVDKQFIIIRQDDFNTSYLNQ